MAATAAGRLGLAPPVAPLERTSVHVDGRDDRDHAPDAPVVHLTRGESREPRPDLHHVMLAVMVEPHAGMPVRMTPLSGHRREAPACGQSVRDPRAQVPTTDGTTALVADRARSREDTRQPRSETRLPWSTRVPGTWSAAPAALAQADLPTRAPRLDGSRARVWTSTSGGVAPRGVRLASAPRLTPAPRTVDQPWRQDRAQDVNAGTHLGRTACAGAADAPQTLSTVAHG